MTRLDKKMELPKVMSDDMFSTQKERDSIDNVRNILIDDIEDFKDHPFKVVENENLYNMVDSISEVGVLNPVIVRPKPNGKYEMISGHRRKLASMLANKEYIPTIVKDLTDEEATILMVDSNIQREELLPSEKAFAYKLKLEAIKQQGKRTDLTSRPLGNKLKSVDLIAENNNDSARQIHRYIRLTELIPELLELVDSKTIAFRPAVELSYLNNLEQKQLFDFIDFQEATPSLSQAIELRKLSEAKTLTDEGISDLLSVEKPNQVEKLKLDKNRFRGVLPKGIKESNVEDFIFKACEYYSRVLKSRENSRD